MMLFITIGMNLRNLIGSTRAGWLVPFNDLQKEQKIICFTLTHSIANYMKSESITEDIGQNIFNLIEKAFNATGYKTLLDLVSSEEDIASSEESISLGEYDEDSYIGL